MVRTITLLKAAQVPLNRAVRPSGYTAQVDEDTYQSLLSRGLIEPEDDEVEDSDPAPAPPADDEDAEDADTVEDVPEPEDDEVEDSDPAPAPPADDGLPTMTAPVAVWREAADKIGIKTSGMKKSEIIGAVKHYLAHQ